MTLRLAVGKLAIVIRFVRSKRKIWGGRVHNVCAFDSFGSCLHIPPGGHLINVKPNSCQPIRIESLGLREVSG